MDIGLTKMSSKGQIVIPADMRKDIKEGEKLLVIRQGDNLILKRIKGLDKKLAEDLEFARRTDEAYERIKSGKGIKMDFDDFIAEMKKW